ncbi:hypothetical protein [Quadrisphaera sp. INWT6]|uniref:hypothetical protein n=1 Tax=Quadrisphaera sp. INWT6 TaxID=2596917 RepID=UPI0018921C18|nr:hypothetical protein [Quadrisphaera sp. INWT6]MBF5082022.1 hypothetical protein [Quadrisphaera sp. INWT6]
MNGPTDLSGGTGGRRDDDPAGSDGADRDVARALRAALGAPQDDDGEGTAPDGSAGGRPPGARPAPRPVPASFLAGVERRAARLHRRRQAGALAGAAAAAAVVIALGGLVLPQLGAMNESASGGSAAGSSADSAAASAPAAGEAAGPQTLQGSGTYGVPDAASGAETFNDASTAGAASLLTAADVTAFAAPVQDAGTSDETGQQLPLTACAEGDAGSLAPVSLWRADLTADPASLPADAVEPPGLVERVATLPSDAEGPQALARVAAQLPACTGAGLEGTGPTTALDAAPVTPVGGEALVLASTSGQGSPVLQVLLVHGAVLVQLQVTSDAPDAQTALDQLVDTARTALERATGGTSTIPARAP